jgi:hypothetical protein
VRCSLSTVSRWMHSGHKGLKHLVQASLLVGLLLATLPTFEAPISRPNIVHRIEQTSPRSGLIPKIGQVARQSRKTLKHSRACYRRSRG